MSESIKLFGRMLNFSTLVLNSDDLTIIETDLKRHIGNQNHADGIPVVVDIEKPIDLEKVFALFRAFGLQPIGIVDGIMTETARKKHVAVFPRGKALQKLEKKGEQGTTLVHERVLRSGQSLSNTEGDLVLMGGINDGAEAIATGSLHVYGNAQGRLVAGATGEPTAAIFCQCLAASLISVAGVYCTKDDIPTDMLGEAVYIKCEKDAGLVFTRMNPAIQ